jgi:hypothetical protein
MSKIFSNAEEKSLHERLAGSRADPTGIFAARVKPKLKELLEVWLPKKKELERLLSPKK